MSLTHKVHTNLNIQKIVTCSMNSSNNIIIILIYLQDKKSCSYLGELFPFTDRIQFAIQLSKFLCDYSACIT